ncbi:hypothetical protein SanaruYs_06840 [Chryseotalea sanaruensis]|uniref:Uncharacterized protein n=1 Tax=Chryseotalea sanaruensis TaxID=2482724 RepID=A0A401U6G9_9BACT|nr:hypothetical protein [Chryseotalea sanaruensis]GCC50469.1 hypothetical protein SanaruYs_06840 [Chryseotalea sanaruensis]
MNRINNYDELVAARRMTETIIADRKRIINEHVDGFKEKLTPVMNIVNIFKNKGSGNSSLLKGGTSLAIDLFVGQKLLRKAGWFTRLIVPTLLRTLSSKVIGNSKKE